MYNWIFVYFFCSDAGVDGGGGGGSVCVLCVYLYVCEYSKKQKKNTSSSRLSDRTITKKKIECKKIVATFSSTRTASR